MIRALIFDFDGLILDTEVPELQSWQEIYAEHGCVLDLTVWAGCLGAGTYWGGFDPYAHLEEQLGRPLPREEIRDRRQRRNLELVATQPVAPGVERYVADAKRLGLRLAVASSSPRRWVAGHLERLGLLSSFDCVKCGDDVGRPKPDPDLYLAALDALGVQADQAIAIEDSPNGIWAAKRAGIFCVAVPNAVTARLSLEHADLQLPSLASLPLEALLVEAQARRALR